MAFVFANYGVRLFEAAFAGAGRLRDVAFAGGAVLVLTVLNVLGVVFGKACRTSDRGQGPRPGLIIVAGFHGGQGRCLGGAVAAVTVAGPRGVDPGEVNFPGFKPSLGVALVLMLYTFGG